MHALARVSESASAHAIINSRIDEILDQASPTLDQFSEVETELATQRSDLGALETVVETTITLLVMFLAVTMLPDWF